MKPSKILLIALLLSGYIGTASGARRLSAGYTWKYNTISQRLLKLEEDNSHISEARKRAFYDPMYAIVDRLIDSAKIRLKPYLHDNSNYSEKEAKVILQTIDSVMVEQYFIVCVEVNLLSEGLTPHQLNGFACQQGYSLYSQQFNEKHPHALFYGVDCDLGSLLYLSIAEVTGLPLRFIEIPTHNFVRWRFNPDKYINYDTNEGEVTTDDFYRMHYVSYFGHKEEINCHFLSDMNEPQIIAYYKSCIAIAISHQGRYDQTEKLYKESITTRPWDALAMNNLSWMYLTVRKYDTKAYYAEAYRLSKSADYYLPSSLENRDTYSCACAAVGNFTKAVEVEKRARNKKPRIIGYGKRMTCYQMGEKIWPTPDNKLVLR